MPDTAKENWNLSAVAAVLCFGMALVRSPALDLTDATWWSGFWIGASVTMPLLLTWRHKAMTDATEARGNPNQEGKDE